MLTPIGSVQTVNGGTPVQQIARRASGAMPVLAALFAALVSLGIAALLPPLLQGQLSSVARAKRTHPFLQKGLASLPLAAQGQISRALGADESAYRIKPALGALHATNPVQRFYAHFDGSGVVVSSGSLRLGLSLRAVGYRESLRTLGMVKPIAKLNRVTYDHPGLEEWYANGPLGLEQAFTILRAPAGHPAGPLTLSMALSGNAHTTLAAGGRSLTLSHAGEPPLTYGGLAATDARGRTLRTWLAFRDGRLRLRVDAHDARYPLRIDPFIQQGEKLTGGGEVVPFASFGYSAALSADGNTALIGAPADNSYVGAAWVFTRSGSAWTQQGGKLTGGGEVGSGTFGRSVALSADGNTALVGGDGDDERGAAWVFVRSGSTWAQYGPKLTVTAPGAGFGSSVALSAHGTSALIGGPGASAAWIFHHGTTSWHENAKLMAGGEAGYSAALSADGNTALLGAPAYNNYAGAAWVFTRSGSRWTQQAKITGGGEIGGNALFGSDVALSSDSNTALIGGYNDNQRVGAAWVFTRSGEEWTQQTKLTGGEYEFGSGVALASDGNEALIGSEGDNSGVGAAYVFIRSGSTWTQQGNKLFPNDSGLGESTFGFSVALSSAANTALIGGPYNNTYLGAAWVFFNPSTPTVTNVKPPRGPVAGGTSVSITGTNLSEVIAVRFGSTAASGFTLNSSASITAISPPESAGTVNVTVTTAEGTSPITSADRYRFTPTVTNLSPNTGSAAGSTTVTVTGTGFAPGTSATTFKFGSSAGTSVSCTSATECTVVSPPHEAGTIDVKATVNKVSSPKTTTDRFLYE